MRQLLHGSPAQGVASRFWVVVGDPIQSSSVSGLKVMRACSALYPVCTRAMQGRITPPCWGTSWPGGLEIASHYPQKQSPHITATGLSGTTTWCTTFRSRLPALQLAW